MRLTEIAMLSDVLGDLLAGDPDYQVIQQLPGIGPVLAVVIIAEIGDITRFPGPAQLCSRAGLTPRHRESDIILSFRVSQGCDLRRPVVDSVVDGTLAV